MVTPLKLEFEPRTIEHLGLQMYSHLPNAVAELVANAYDADASEVFVQLLDVDGAQEVLVIDNGHGMSAKDLADKYLRIGRNRRLDTGDSHSESGRRLVSGKKGIGKLALFGIGTIVRLETKRMNANASMIVKMDWKEILASTGHYYPTVTNGRKPHDWQGTIISLGGLRRTTRINAQELARSLSALFNYADAGFKVFVVDSAKHKFIVDRESRIGGLDAEFSWDIPGSFGVDLDHYFASRGISGRIIASRKPVRQLMRGITLFANGRLINEPEFFGAAESSFAFSYLSGYIDVDFLDDCVPDVIASDRRAVNWEVSETAELRERLVELLTIIASDWRTRRSKTKRERAEKTRSTTFDHWTSTVKGPERKPLEELLTTIVSSDVDMAEDLQDQLIENLERIAPPFADLLWRHLHPDVQEPARIDYEMGRYFHAVDEAIKRYVTDVEIKSKITGQPAFTLMNQAFGKSNARLQVFDKYFTIADNHIAESTAGNVEEGQKFLSAGLICAIRNPLAHQEKERLLACGAFTHEDCLDALSLLSHLRRRLDDAELC